MPTRKIWDHAIDLKKTFKPWKERIYPLSKKERESSELCGGSIEKRVHQTVKSPQTSPVFFVDKKNRSKQIVIDYHNLNDQIVKNNYPLPLITDLIDNMDSKKVFTKMNLR